MGQENLVLSIFQRIPGKVVHLAWQDDRDGTVEVYYKRSLDDGVTWGQDVRLSNLTPQTFDPEPRLGTDGHTVLVVYSNRTPTGEHLFYVVSNDGGDDFSTPIQLTHDLGDQSNTALAFVGSTVHVVWQELLNDGEEHILYANSANAGVTWQQEMDLTNASSSQDQYATITAAGSSVFVAWSRMYEGTEAIYARVSLNSGETWQPEAQVSNYVAQSFPEFPAIGTNGTYLYLVWGSVRGIQYSRSSNLGATWSTPLALTNATRQYVAPRIAVANTQIQVVTAGILGFSSDVYYLSSSDAGASWNPTVSLSAHGPDKLSLAPVISSNGDSTFVAWEDNTNGRLAIFFLSRPDFTVLANLEELLSITIVIVLCGATIAYLGFELKHSRASVHKQMRKRRLYRKHARRGKASAR